MMNQNLKIKKLSWQQVEICKVHFYDTFIAYLKNAPYFWAPTNKEIEEHFQYIKEFDSTEIFEMKLGDVNLGYLFSMNLADFAEQSPALKKLVEDNRQLQDTLYIEEGLSGDFKILDYITDIIEFLKDYSKAKSYQAIAVVGTYGSSRENNSGSDLSQFGFTKFPQQFAMAWPTKGSNGVVEVKSHPCFVMTHKI